jgi:1-acyl-sn-glycerol-3-phosphate acyltransferase
VAQVSGQSIPIGYQVAKVFAGPPLRASFDLSVDGIAHVPTDGPVIIAANHRSFIDSLFLAAVVPRPVRFMAKAEYFDRRGVAWIFRATGQIPVRRGSAAGARHALTEARRVLDDGGVIGVYPEGTRSRDGDLHVGTRGTAHLAVTTGTPIVPVGLIGTQAVQPPDRRMPRFGKPVAIRFGAPLWPDGHPASRREHVQQLTDELMQTIARLSGQHYADRPALLVPA